MTYCATCGIDVELLPLHHGPSMRSLDYIGSGGPLVACETEAETAEEFVCQSCGAAYVSPVQVLDVPTYLEAA